MARASEASDGMARHAELVMRCSPGEREQIVGAAYLAGKPVSTFAREAALLVSNRLRLRREQRLSRDECEARTNTDSTLAVSDLTRVNPDTGHE